MKVIVVRPGYDPVVEKIEDTLEAMQTIVGGYIEAVYPFEDYVALLCNEESKLNGMPPNRCLFNDDGDVLDIIFGTFFLCGAPADAEDFTSIPDDLIEKYIKKFSY